MRFQGYLAVLENITYTFASLERDARIGRRMTSPFFSALIQVGKGPWASEVSGIVKIGQTMTMVLAIKDDENKFDMLVRNCVAHDGLRAPIQLVDQYGCVTRPKIMSRFQKVRNFGPSASVVSYAYFQAFKFPDSMNVHFQCVIQVCRNNCPEPKCDGSGTDLGYAASTNQKVVGVDPRVPPVAAAQVAAGGGPVPVSRGPPGPVYPSVNRQGVAAADADAAESTLPEPRYGRPRMVDSRAAANVTDSHRQRRDAQELDVSTTRIIQVRVLRRQTNQTYQNSEITDRVIARTYLMWVTARTEMRAHVVTPLFIFLAPWW